MAFIIFDLDHTVIDSSHRQLTLPDGSLDLEHWIENCTHEKIMADSLLPLADSMKRFYAEGHTIIVCTARSGECVSDKSFLDANGLRYHHWLSRGDSMEGDAALKVRLLNEFAQSQGFANIGAMRPIMFDDNLKVIQALQAERVAMFDAISYNRQMARGKRMPYNHLMRYLLEAA